MLWHTTFPRTKLKKKSQKAKVKKSKKQNMPKKPFSKDLKPQLTQGDK